jgi:uncharacterized protein YwlG (UPF0340 family)
MEAWGCYQTEVFTEVSDEELVSLVQDHGAAEVGDELLTRSLSEVAVPETNCIQQIELS